MLTFQASDIKLSFMLYHFDTFDDTGCWELLPEHEKHNPNGLKVSHPYSSPDNDFIHYCLCCDFCGCFDVLYRTLCA